MVKLKGYASPELVVVMIEEDVVRTSSTPGEEEGELPVQPFFL